MHSSNQHPESVRVSSAKFLQQFTRWTVAASTAALIATPFTALGAEEKKKKKARVLEVSISFPI